MTKKTLLLAASIVTVAVGGVSYAALTNTRMPVEFYKGHTHADGVTHGAPQHSGAPIAKVVTMLQFRITVIK